jgi:hypothetical protein
MKAGLFVNINTGWPTPSRWREVRGLRYVRMLAYDIQRTMSLFALSAPPTSKAIILLNNESEDVGSDWAGLELACITLAIWARHYGVLDRIAGVEIGNELDLWGVPYEQAVELWQRAAEPLVDDGLTPILGSLAGPDWVNYLRNCHEMLADDGTYHVGGVAFHPYGKRPEQYPYQIGTGNLTEALDTVASITGGVPIWLTELGLKLRDATPFSDDMDEALQLQGRYVTDVLEQCEANQFVRTVCLSMYSDNMGAPGERGIDGFGLVNSDNTPRLGWKALQDFCAKHNDTITESEVTTVPPSGPFEIGPGVEGVLKQLGTEAATREIYQPQLGKDGSRPHRECMSIPKRLTRRVTDWSTYSARIRCISIPQKNKPV